MRDRLLVELIAEFVEEAKSTKKVSSLRLRYEKILSNYEIEVRNTELMPSNWIPEELKVYLVTKKVEGLAEGTLYNKFLLLKGLFEDVRRPISEIDTNTIRLWLFKVQKERGVSNRSLDGYRIIVSSFFQWCVDNDYLSKNPCKPIPTIKYVVNRRGYLTQEELEEIRNKVVYVRDRVIIELYYSTGMRCTEITTIKMKDVDIQNKKVMVFNEKGKRYKTCYLNDKAIYWLKKYIPTRKGENEYLIQGLRYPYDKISKDAIEAMIRRLMVKCDINKKVTPSTFRHTTATQGLNNGMSLHEVQKILDHKNPATTLVYADIIEDDLQSSHRKAII